VQGVLENEAVASISLRKAKSASDDTNIRWIITGTEGEIEYIIAESGQYQAGAQPKLRVKYGKSAEAEEVMAVIDETPASKVSPPGTNTARLYEGFAKEDGQTVTFASALKTHHLLERIATSSGWTL
jgi:predicted dehydrogenase